VKNLKKERPYAVINSLTIPQFLAHGGEEMSFVEYVVYNYAAQKEVLF